MIYDLDRSCLVEWSAIGIIKFGWEMRKLHWFEVSHVIMFCFDSLKLGGIRLNWCDIVDVRCEIFPMVYGLLILVNICSWVRFWYEHVKNTWKKFQKHVLIQNSAFFHVVDVCHCSARYFLKLHLLRFRARIILIFGCWHFFSYISHVHAIPHAFFIFLQHWKNHNSQTTNPNWLKFFVPWSL